MLQIRKNPLDLNNLPEDYSERWREGKQVFEETSEVGDNTSMDDKTKEKKDEGRKRKCCANEGKEGCGKVYECRFCSLKFCKSQALGGHMNRHRQERETETLNRARQLVYSNENMVVPGLNIGLRDQNLAGAPAIPTGNFHQRTGVEVPLPYPSIFTRPPSPGSPAIFSQSQPYLYHHPSASRLLPFPAQFTQQPDYLIGHVLPGNSHYHHHPNPPNYWKTIDGEPNSGGFANNPAAGEAAPYNQVEGGGAGWVSFQEDQQGQVPATMQQRFQDNF